MNRTKKITKKYAFVCFHFSFINVSTGRQKNIFRKSNYSNKSNKKNMVLFNLILVYIKLKLTGRRKKF